MEADWFYQSFCSAHLEQRHQWGEGIGMEDDVYFTNEEWINYSGGTKFVGIGVSCTDARHCAEVVCHNHSRPKLVASS